MRDGYYDAVYSLNLSDTTAKLYILEHDCFSSQFDHLVLQLDDIVLSTPFAGRNKARQPRLTKS